MTMATHPLLRFRKALILFLIVLVYGTVGYWAIERWNPFDSAYMTIITISTVGYREVHTLSTLGRIFTATLIVGGVATMLYAFSVFSEMLHEGAIGTYQRRLSQASRRRSLREHFIICGYGRMGTQVAREFDEDGVPYVVVDSNPEAVTRMQRDGRVFVEGDAASEEVLGDAGIERARGLISTVDADEKAVYITLAARALNPALYILARAGHPESVRRLELAGANRVISPYRMAGRQVAMMAIRPGLVEVMETLQHGESAVAVEELLVLPGSKAIGRTLGECELFGDRVASLLALRRHDGHLHVNPPHELIVEEGDLVVALGSRPQLETTAALLQ
jgi:voltage-gated potassium channel